MVSSPRDSARAASIRAEIQQLQPGLRMLESYDREHLLTVIMEISDIVRAHNVDAQPHTAVYRMGQLFQIVDGFSKVVTVLRRYNALKAELTNIEVKRNAG